MFRKSEPHFWVPSAWSTCFPGKFNAISPTLHKTGLAAPQKRKFSFVFHERVVKHNENTCTVATRALWPSSPPFQTASRNALLLFPKQCCCWWSMEAWSSFAVIFHVAATDGRLVSAWSAREIFIKYMYFKMFLLLALFQVDEKTICIGWEHLSRFELH